jgi:predicted nucleic acid-binding protein
MIVVDSSVWIAQLRRGETPALRKFREIEDPFEAILVGDLVLLEVLQGARDEAHARTIELMLRKFAIEPMLDEVIAVKAAVNYRMLRSVGITLGKTVDLIIATFCAERGHSLLHDDRDFDLIAPHLGLAIV